MCSNFVTWPAVACWLFWSETTWSVPLSVYHTECFHLQLSEGLPSVQRKPFATTSAIYRVACVGNFSNSVRTPLVACRTCCLRGHGRCRYSTRLGALSYGLFTGRTRGQSGIYRYRTLWDHMMPTPPYNCSQPEAKLVERTTSEQPTHQHSVIWG